jgi:hypothetical protein
MEGEIQELDRFLVRKKRSPCTLFLNTDGFGSGVSFSMPGTVVAGIIPDSGQT